MSMLNVKEFGVKGDGAFIPDCLITSNSYEVVSPTPSFTRDDVGKSLWAVASEALVVPICSIVEYVNPFKVKISVKPQYNGLAETHFGTDDTDALIDAFECARDHDKNRRRSSLVRDFRQVSKELYVPTGIYHFRKVVLDNYYPQARVGVSMVGDGVGRSIFVARPDFDFDTTVVNQGMFNRSMNSGEVNIMGLSVAGGNYRFSDTPGCYGMIIGGLSGRAQPTYTSLGVSHFIGLIGGAKVMELGGGSISDSCFYENESNSLLIISCHVTLRNCIFTSANGYGCQVLNVFGDTNNSYGVAFRDCIFDEHANASLFLNQSSGILVDGCRVMSGKERTSVELYKSSCKFRDSDLIPFHNHPGTTGLLMDSESKGHVNGCRIIGSHRSCINLGSLVAYNTEFRGTYEGNPVQAQENSFHDYTP